jgi:hypothetical protein
MSNDVASPLRLEPQPVDQPRPRVAELGRSTKTTEVARAWPDDELAKRPRSAQSPQLRVRDA